MSGYFGSVAVNRKRHEARVVACAAGLLILAASAVAGILLLSPNPHVTAATRQSTIVASDEDIPVLLALRDIAEGERLEPGLFATDMRPRRFVSESNVASLRELEGKYAKAFLAAGQPLVRPYVTNVRAAGPISNTIPKGYRAVTIRVNDLSSLNGMVRPGEFVDVSWIHTRRSVPALSVIVNGAKILAVDSQVESAAKQSWPIPGTATLLLSEDDRTRVQLAENQGKLTLALRNPEDVLGGPLDTINIDDVIPQPAGDEHQMTEDKRCKGGTIRSCEGRGACLKYCIDETGTIEPME